MPCKAFMVAVDDGHFRQNLRRRPTLRGFVVGQYRCFSGWRYAQLLGGLQTCTRTERCAGAHTRCPAELHPVGQADTPNLQTSGSIRLFRHRHGAGDFLRGELGRSAQPVVALVGADQLLAQRIGLFPEPHLMLVIGGGAGFPRLLYF